MAHLFRYRRVSSTFLADTAHNLPLMHGTAVLNEVLIQLRDEGKFGGYRGRLLGRLMELDKTTLPWADFELIEHAVRARNDVAHGGALLPGADCWKYIDAIEKEPATWGIVTPAPAVPDSIELRPIDKEAGNQ